MAVGLVLALQALYLLVSPPNVARQDLRDADSYMRVLRVVDLHETGKWYDSHFNRTNAPLGETLHWGRALDGVLYGAAWVIARGTDFRTGVYWAGLCLGPVLMLLSVPLWSWGTRPFLSNGGLLLLLGFTVMTTQLRGQLEFGRPDHHGFLIVLFIAQLAAACRLATRSEGKWTAVVLGVAGGVALWASVEALLVQASFAVVLAYLMVRRAPEGKAHVFTYALALWCTVTVALMLERPPATIFRPDYIRMSIVHWTLVSAVVVAWWLVQKIEKPLVALAVGGVIPLAVMACVFPDFFRGPLVGHDNALMGAWFATIQEFQPLMPTSKDRLLFFLLHCGPVMVGLGACIYELRHDADHRDLHVVFLILLVIYGALALSSARWVIYAQALSLAPWALAVTRLAERPAPLGISAVRYISRIAAVASLFCAPFLTATLGAALIPMPYYVADANKCDWTGIEAFLNDLHTADPQHGVLFTYLYRGPEIVWHTPYSVVSAPYGNDDAIRDTNTIFEAKDDAVARRRIAARGVGLILECRDEPENDLYRRAGDGSLLSRLQSGQAPEWLQAIDVPGALGRSFKLFRVVGR